jgi:hypothetical protein
VHGHNLHGLDRHAKPLWCDMDGGRIIGGRTPPRPRVDRSHLRSGVGDLAPAVGSLGRCVWLTTAEGVDVSGGDSGPLGGRRVRPGQRLAAEGNAGSAGRRDGPALPGSDPAPTGMAGRSGHAGRRVGIPGGGVGSRGFGGRPSGHVAQPGYRPTTGSLAHQSEYQPSGLVGCWRHGGGHRCLPVSWIASKRHFVGLGLGVVVGGDHRPPRRQHPFTPRSTPWERKPGVAPRFGRRCVLRSAGCCHQGVRPAEGGGWLAPALVGLGLALVGIALLATADPPVRAQPARA